jgi:hypothetical protein
VWGTPIQLLSGNETRRQQVEATAKQNNSDEKLKAFRSCSRNFRFLRLRPLSNVRLISSVDRTYARSSFSISKSSKSMMICTNIRTFKIKTNVKKCNSDRGTGWRRQTGTFQLAHVSDFPPSIEDGRENGESKTYFNNF